MKRLLLAILVLPLIGFVASCTSNTQQETTTEQTTDVVFMTNIYCDGCVNTVQTKMPDREGVEKALADLETKKVTVTYNPSKIDLAGIITAFSDLGYEASVFDENSVVQEQPADTVSIVE